MCCYVTCLKYYVGGICTHQALKKASTYSYKCTYVCIWMKRRKTVISLLPLRRSAKKFNLFSIFHFTTSPFLAPPTNIHGKMYRTKGCSLQRHGLSQSSKSVGALHVQISMWGQIVGSCLQRFGEIVVQ